MIVGYDKVDNILHELAEQKVFGTINGDRINSGQFIGYIKNIKKIIKAILYNTKSFKTDQIELTNYINQNNQYFFIDKKKQFFNVATYPLQQIKNNNKTASFIHANANGLLENFLLEHHNIIVNPIDKKQNYKDNFKGVIKKINIYKKYFFKLT